MKNINSVRFATANIPAEGVWKEGEISFQALAVDTEDRFSFPDPLHYRLHLTVVNNDVLVSGKMSGSMMVMCDRCTETAVYELEQEDIFHRYENVFGEVIDLTDDLREDILLIFPQSFLCADECRGLCLSCGCNLNHDQCTCDIEARADEDDPWRNLDNLQL